MKIFGNPGSTCTRKVLMTAHENGAPFEFVLVDMAKGEHKQPAHLARQPFGQVPTLDDDGFAMYESRAMARYIDGKFGGALTPKDAQARALQLRSGSLFWRYGDALHKRSGCKPVWTLSRCAGRRY